MEKKTDIEQRAFSFLRFNQREPKPRTRGLTEIRGSDYTLCGKNQLTDLLEIAGDYVDSFKWVMGSWAITPRRVVKETNDLCHRYNVLVSTGGGTEAVVRQGPEAVNRYLEECKQLGFDIVEVSSSLVKLSTEDWVRLTEKVQKAGLKAKPEISLGGAAYGSEEELETAGVLEIDPRRAIQQAKKHLEAGAWMIHVESEGITEMVPRNKWRLDVSQQLGDELGLDKLIFEAAELNAFSWYVKNFGPEVNLFIDHTQIVVLECFRQGIWGMRDFWGRVITYKG